MSNNHRQLRALDTNRLLKSYREMSNNALKLYGADNAIVSYQNKKKVHTILVPATWKLVYAYAVVNALAVTAVKFVVQT